MYSFLQQQNVMEFFRKYLWLMYLLDILLSIYLLFMHIQLEQPNEEQSFLNHQYQKQDKDFILIIELSPYRLL
jgi:hypothetical protein